MAINWIGIAALGSGGLLLYSAVTNKKFSQAARATLSGQSPGTVTTDAATAINTSLMSADTGTGQASGTAGTTAGTAASKFLGILRQHLGQAYVYGGTSINATDCSGLVYFALKQMGINAPRTSQQQYTWSQKISQGQLQPGDLVFTQWGAAGPGPDHVGIYLGNGQVLQDPHTGAVVDIVSLSGFISGQKQVGYGRIPGL